MLTATATKLGITFLDAHGIAYYGTINIQDANTKINPSGIKGASATALAFTQASPIKSQKDKPKTIKHNKLPKTERTGLAEYA